MPLRMSQDETRAVAFIAFLLVASMAVRFIGRPAPFEPQGEAVDLSELERASRAKQAGPPSLGPGERVDPNTASADQLAKLPGASRTIVDRIIADRASGPYRSAADLERVAGIGPATVQKWRDRIALPATGPPTGESGAIPAPARPASAPTGELVDLNRAGEADLERLPGVGPVLARRIVAFRDSIGGFRAVGQLVDVRGVGPAMMRRLEPLIRIGS